ncbi:patatin-like phospholipase domain-containing protein [Raphidocelis subcapitata]|uniref:Patatin n=1 Tax=Raphidocelis subcapitata TaxID=307507 RepID=A0A2V0NTU6_9CHLO|nr:patatin-like phospholipase domain-containing protein [Raphidocelis subcapitata]|eukprot:GBF88990.1 patatin-like phospholipase domain-containing protein [Raphidocelis subcapitata]
MRRGALALRRGTGDGALNGAVSGGLQWLKGWDVTRAYGARGGVLPETGAGTADTGSSDATRSSSGSSTGGPPTPRASLDGGPGSGSSTDSGDGGGSGGRVAVWDPRKQERIRVAFQNDTLSFGFSAGGLMFPYYVGVVSALEEMGVLRRPHQLAGASAGSLVAAAYNSGLDMRTVEESLVAFGEDCLRHGTRSRLGPLLRDFLHAYLPPDAHERCAGNTHVAWTRVVPYWRPHLVSQFRSRDDLIEALLTSCHIPWYFDGRWMTKFRGHFAVDGGATNFIPVVPGSDYTCKVMCFPTGHLEAIRSRAGGVIAHPAVDRYLEIDISLDAFESWPHDWPTVIKWALQASTRETGSFLIEKGKRDARAWAVAAGLEPLLAAKAAAAGAGASVAAARAWDGGGIVLGHAGAAAATAAAAAAEVSEAFAEAGERHARKRRREDGEQEGSSRGDGADGHAPAAAAAAAAAREPEPVGAAPGLTGQPRSDTNPIHGKPPA